MNIDEVRSWTKLPMLAVLSVIFVVAGVGGVPPTENALLVQVLDAVQRTLNFFAEDYSAINVDGLFGLRLGQGQMREAVRECRVRTCDAPLLRRLTDIEALLNNASDSALPYLEAEDPAYFTRFHATIDQPYVLPYQGELVEAAFDTGVEEDLIEKSNTGAKVDHIEMGDTGAIVGTNENYNEEAGDACYARMLGSYQENEKTLPRCNITTNCWKYMTQDDTAAYFITHQLLYFIMTEHVGCKGQLEAFTQGRKIRELQHKFCRKIYQESKQLSSTGKVKNYRRDLFLEQTVLCGPLGFENFYRSDWIRMVLSWPDKRLGCFRQHSVDDDLKALMGDLAATVQSGHQRRNTHPSSYETTKDVTMRRLLREKQMKDGCLSHTSGLGFGVLCSYLRFLVRHLYTSSHM
ncbi:UPF0764 protein C16orf89 homolog [Dreissena polymorpha]|uniref:Uncharacterized protein n=1 Tax=Dreissena polymorpha TaxID=45954 RepID=A0A9D4S182_DREPO|nr:UPF0764 protein C16orf89 homolog [Dreissena polymorpha]KAH3886112.1 hypothetical protein DPMN_010113 [Dreissena polymorpha]